MAVQLTIVDAFASRPFTGNPAAVCILQQSHSDAWMQLVARELNLSETCFIERRAEGFNLRWFTPAAEVKLCGHATLASAHVVWANGLVPDTDSVRFDTLSGWLECRRSEGGWIEMDFPATVPVACAIPSGLEEALGCTIIHCARSEFDLLVEVDSEKSLRAMQPNFSALSTYPVRGVIATCQSSNGQYDFLSRFFAPAVAVNEDPVTGSAHCALAPYWQKRMGKSDFVAFQASLRGGVVKAAVRGARVTLSGQAVTMSVVEFLHDTI